MQSSRCVWGGLLPWTHSVVVKHSVVVNPTPQEDGETETDTCLVHTRDSLAGLGAEREEMAWKQEGGEGEETETDSFVFQAHRLLYHST